MYFRHNSFDLNYREPFGALPTGSRVTLKVEAHDVMNIRVRTYYRGTERFFDMLPTNTPNTFSCTIGLPEEPGLFWYDFRFDAFDQTYYYGNAEDGLGGEGRISQTQPASYQITLFDDERKAPAWYREGIMYQIFPDRFAKSDKYHGKYYPGTLIHGDWSDSPHYFRREDSSIEHWDFFGGNIQGIIEKLDYLKTLNVTILYLNPIFESRSNHKYDTADYSRIAPEFGTEEDFKELCREAKKRGIHVILDGVFSHTGDDSVYFNKYGHYPGVGAYQSQDSPYYDWYRFSNYPNEYESWWGIGSMPNVEELTPSYQNYIFKGRNAIIRKWMRAGASGWRLDVADELPDEFIAGVKKTMVSEKKDSVLIGEVWEDASNKVAYGVHRQYFMGHELDAVMNYPFRETFIQFFLGQCSSSDATRRMMSLYSNYPRTNFMGSMNLIGSHDRVRILTVLSGVSGSNMSEAEKENFRLTPQEMNLAVKRLKLMSLLQMTFPGVPCIYYGDEVGCQGFEDPFNRGTYPWGSENLDLYGWYRDITDLRASYNAFKKGRWYPLVSESDDLFVYFRTYREEAILCLFNRNCSEYITYHHPLIEGKYGVDLMKKIRDNLSGVTVPPLSAKIYLVDENARRLIQNYHYGEHEFL